MQNIGARSFVEESGNVPALQKGINGPKRSNRMSKLLSGILKNIAVVDFFGFRIVRNLSIRSYGVGIFWRREDAR